MTQDFKALGPSYDRELRFIAMIEGEATGLLRTARAVLGVHALVAPLFAGATAHNSIGGMERFHLIRLPGVSWRELAKNPYDIAQRLRDEGGYPCVTPDLPRRPALGSQSFIDVCAINGIEGFGRWSPGAMQLTQAWDRIAAAGAGLGLGVSIGHLDTGIRPHIALDNSRIDRNRSYNVLTGTGDTTDPIHAGFLLNPGHGTETAAVALGNNLSPLTGVAPEATLVDVRCTDSVVLFFNTDVAQAIWHATKVGCEVITMSLGGTPELCTEIALMNAAASNVIVVTAAGNCVPFVTYPASSVYSLAIAASNITALPWTNSLGGPGSSFGAKVDISAPGQDLEVPAVTDPVNPTAQFHAGRGTSFAVAAVAGTAALWVAYRRTTAAGSVPRNLFQQLLRQTATMPGGWDTDLFGTGIVNINNLIAASGHVGAGQPETAAALPRPNPENWLAAVLDCTRAQAAEVLQVLFQRSSSKLGIDEVPLITELVRQLTDRPVIARQIANSVGRKNFTADRIAECLRPAFLDFAIASGFSDFFRERTALAPRFSRV
jgi:hypothetical protein